MDKCAFDNGNKCHAVTDKVCLGCKFRKTKEELKAGREKASARLMTLDRTLLNEIKQKYYTGRRGIDERT